MSLGRTLALALSVASLALLLACRDQSAAKPPEASVSPVEGTSAAPDQPASPAAPADSAAAPASASASASASAGRSIKESLGSVAKIEVTGERKMELTKQADVDALLTAIGTDQVPSGVLRRCPDEIVLTMKDASGKEKGNVGLCVSDTLGPEFFTGPGDRKGITLADDAAVRKALKIEPPKAGAKK